MNKEFEFETSCEVYNYGDHYIVRSDNYGGVFNGDSVEEALMHFYKAMYDYLAKGGKIYYCNDDGSIEYKFNKLEIL